MAQRRVRVQRADDGAPAGLLAGVFDQIRSDLQVPQRFPDEVLAEAERAAKAPDLPDADLTDVPFFTVDPIGSTDLDQAMHLARSGRGFRVRYAIADVPAFVVPGGAVDLEARRRGQTLYAPDARTPLHPPVISEDVGSLLPGLERPAFVWDLELDADGEVRSADLHRAMVRSVDRLDYLGVQRQVDAGADDERFELLGKIGRLRLVLEQQRGGSSLPLPEEEVVPVDGGYRLRLRPPSDVEDWNAQISLMTGTAAADMMLAGQVGILRTMPAPDGAAIARFRRQAGALGARWPAEQTYGAFLRTLDRSDPHHLALIHEATSLFRGAGYTPFVGAVPEASEHAAVADQYAHVTAPLRRLVDRFGLVVCAALCADTSVPDWVLEALPQLPAVMTSSDQRANRLDRECTNAVEAAVLAGRVGEQFQAVVVDLARPAPGGGSGRPAGGSVQLLDPPVSAKVVGDVRLGAMIPVRLTLADVEQRRVEFTPA
jgi:exoribonuclease R